MKSFISIILLLLVGCVTTGPKIDKAKMAEGYYMKGLSHLQEKNYELASVEFNRSIQTDSDFKQSYYGLGIINDDQGKSEDAIKYYKEAIKLDPEFSEAYNALGRVYSKQQKWQEALKCYKKALENKLYTTPHVPHLNSGLVYMEMKEYDKAVEAFREAKRFVNQDFIVYQLGTALYEAGKYKEAIAELQEGVGMTPQNATMRFSLALAFFKDGNKKFALTEFRKVADLDPKGETGRKANDYIQRLR